MTPQKHLTLHCIARTMAHATHANGCTKGRRRLGTSAGSSSYYYWRRKTSAISNNFARTRKKDLTFLAFALILAQGTFGKSSSYYYWRPRAKILLSSTGERVAAGACSTWNITHQENTRKRLPK